MLQRHRWVMIDYSAMRDAECNQRHLRMAHQNSECTGLVWDLNMEMLKGVIHFSEHRISDNINVVLRKWGVVEIFLRKGFI